MTREEREAEEVNERHRQMLAQGSFLPGWMWVLVIPIGLWIGISFAKDDPPPAPSPERIAEEERLDAERVAFEKQQAPLWRIASKTMTADRIIEEMGKCQNAIRAKSRSPYQLMFDSYDADQQARFFREDGLEMVKMVTQQRQEFPRKVELATWQCEFKGIGFSEVRKEPGSVFMPNYIPD